MRVKIYQKEKMKQLVGNFILENNRHIIFFSWVVPLITSSPLNPKLQGSILNHSFPMQRSHSEIQIIPDEPPHNRIGE